MCFEEHDREPGGCREVGYRRTMYAATDYRKVNGLRGALKLLKSALSCGVVGCGGMHRAYKNSC